MIPSIKARQKMQENIRLVKTDLLTYQQAIDKNVAARNLERCSVPQSGFSLPRNQYYRHPSIKRVSGELRGFERQPRGKGQKHGLVRVLGCCELSHM